MTKKQRLLSRFGAIVLLGIIAYFVDRPISHASTDKIHVIDGDTLLLNGKKARLIGIDAPEMQQICQTYEGKNYACGKESAKHLESIISGAAVQCDVMDKDQYKRDLVLCKKGELVLNQQMVEDGWAVLYYNDHVSYRREEFHAQRDKRGMWKGSFQTPQAYKREHR
jgi:endonuclease YncB( thermonuclease family)